MKDIVCIKHPQYKGARPPKKTVAYPEGCPKCWERYQQVCVRKMQKMYVQVSC